MIRTHILAAATLAFASTTAFAADVYVGETYTAPVAAAPLTYNWTGFYAGISAGARTGDAEIGVPGFWSEDLSVSGFIGGVHVGYDWQMDNNFVLGAVTDISTVSGDADILGYEVGSLEYLGTVRARAGFAWDRALVYAHGGFAYGKIKSEVFAESKTHTGWTVGAGLEYALTENVSFGTEYSYVDLGTETYGGFVDVDTKFHTVKATLSYRF